MQLFFILSALLPLAYARPALNGQQVSSAFEQEIQTTNYHRVLVGGLVNRQATSDLLGGNSGANDDEDDVDEDPGDLELPGVGDDGEDEE